MIFQFRNRLLALEERYKNRSFSASEFTKLIRRQFPAADFSFRTHRDYAVDPDMILVSGLYDCYNEAQGSPAIEITLSYHPEQDTYFGQLINWDSVSFDIAECIGHELVHQRQHKKKTKLAHYASDDSEKEYLGDESEIDAYGFSIALESVIYDKNYTECSMYRVYQRIFDTDHSVIVKLEKQIIKYLKEMELKND
jgi:hypothetical protein